MFEPRGHDMMSGSILYPPTRADCDVGILFIETSGCLPMCGHGTIGTVTMALENGLVAPKTPGLLRLDTPAGLVDGALRAERPLRRAGAHHQRRRPSSTASELRGRRAEGLGELSVDVAYGGNFYAIVEPQPNYSRPRRRRARRTSCAGARSCARRFNEKLRDRASREPGDQPAHATSCGPASRRRRAARPQRRVLRRQGDRPLALRHRHLGAHGAARRARASSKEGDDFVHESIIGSTVRRPRRGRDRRSATTTPSSPRSTAGRAITGLNTIFDRRPRPVRARLPGGGPVAREPPVIPGP